MARGRGVAVAVWGVFSILTGAVMTEGGLMEVIVNWPLGAVSHVAVGALGAVASALLLASGVAFCSGRPFGRRMAVAGAAAMVPVHGLGWVLGFVGVPGMLAGVAYPALLQAVLKARPNLGTPVPIDHGQARAGTSPSDHSRLRVALGPV